MYCTLFAAPFADLVQGHGSQSYEKDGHKSTGVSASIAPSRNSQNEIQALWGTGDGHREAT